MKIWSGEALRPVLHGVQKFLLDTVTPSSKKVESPVCGWKMRHKWLTVSGAVMKEITMTVEAGLKSI